MDKFKTILDFTKFKKNCVFCQTPLRASLTNFIGVRDSGIPIINSHLKDGTFDFVINHTTDSYSVEVDAVVEARSNIVLLTCKPTDTPSVDEYIAIQVFDGLRPHIDMYCANKSCKMKYHLSSDYFKLVKVSNVKSAWEIKPISLFLEGFQTKTLFIQNDYSHSFTYIYSLKNENADPIKTSLIDFSSMDKEKLLNRIQLLVTFS
jgi:hypothetical protein